jgi:nucleoside 2-deoxyribosyltransferase
MEKPMSKEQEWMKEAAEKSGKKIIESDMYLSVFTQSYLKDPRCALELGFAILMDKPISLVVFDDTEVPNHLQTIAFAIERVKDRSADEMARAIKSITEKLNVYFK